MPNNQAAIDIDLPQPAPVPPTVLDVAPKKPSLSELRDTLRTQIFSPKVQKSKILTFFGAEIELRQPKLGDVMKTQDKAQSEEAAVINTLVLYAYVPGTDVKVFEAGDAESMHEMPFGRDFIQIQEALNDLTEVNFPRPNSNSNGTTSSTA